MIDIDTGFRLSHLSKGIFRFFLIKGNFEIASVCLTIYGIAENNQIVQVDPIEDGLSGNGVTTFYWDCCKPYCSWNNNAPHNTSPVKTCGIDGIHRVNPKTQNACFGKNRNEAFACNDQQAWALNDTLAYGFVAFSKGGGEENFKCCSCFKLDFQGELIIRTNS